MLFCDVIYGAKASLRRFHKQDVAHLVFFLPTELVSGKGLQWKSWSLE